MALNTQFSDTLVDAMAVAFATKFDGAKIAIITGTKTGSTTTGTNSFNGVVLVRFTMGSPAFGSPTSGVLVANAIATATAGAFTGTPTFARFFDSTLAGNATDASLLGSGLYSSVLMECTAGTSNANLIISPITAGTNVSIGSFTHEVTNAFSGQ